MWNKAKTILTILVVIAACSAIAFSFYLKSYVTPANPVTLTVVTDQPLGYYYINQTVIIYFILRNEGNSDVTLHFTSSYQIDYEIIQGSETLYTWSSDKGFMQAFTRIVIPAHGTVVRYLEHTPEDYYLKQGTYEVRGFLSLYRVIGGEYKDYCDQTFITIRGPI